MDYLDHNATTLLDHEVWQHMLPYFVDFYANPSSRHRLGEAQRHVVEGAREKVAQALGVEPVQVVFTSGGTEANNLFFHGMTEGRIPKQVCVSPYEHPCVLEPARALASKGWKFLELLSDAAGRLPLEMNHNKLMHLQKGDILSLMAVNNETGVIQPVAALSERMRSQGVIVHTDAVQAVGKIPFSFKELGVDALTLSTHKCGGPKGVGALVVSKRLDIQPLLRGGGQEKGRRSGTEPVGLIVGFAEALIKAMARQSEWLKHVKPLTEMLEHGLRARGAEIFGSSVDRVANTTYFAFNGIHGDSWVMYLDRAGLAVSSGSACSSQHATVSHVLTAMGYNQEKAMSAVRVSLGWCNTVATIQSFLTAIDAGLKEFSGMMGMVSPHKAI